MSSLEAARKEILSRLSPLGSEVVELAAALGRTLAEPVESRDAIPPFDNTAMDGFVVQHRDLAAASEENRVVLPIAEVIQAGQPATRPLEQGEVMRIFTGAPIPDRGDAIVPFEHCHAYDEDSATFQAPDHPSAHIRRSGEDFEAGQIVLESGTKLSPAAVGVLATVGSPRISVVRRPRVAVHSSGDELVPIEAELTPGKIRNSNLASIVARLQQWGAEAIPRPLLIDEREAIREGLQQTLALKPDAIITTGGISAGDVDHIRDIAQEMGSEVAVRKVDMKPGKPLVDGLIAGIPFFGLPGNPAACLVSFEIFVRPALALLEGRSDGVPPRHRAKVSEGRTFPRAGRLQFLRGRVDLDEKTGEWVLAPLSGQGSHLLSSFAAANCLVRVGPEVDRLNTGDHVDVLLLGAS